MVAVVGYRGLGSGVGGDEGCRGRSRSGKCWCWFRWSLRVSDSGCRGSIVVVVKVKVQ